MESTTYLAHHGILGQKWGVRRYQNPDGSLTDAGKKKYYVGRNGQLVKKNTDGKIKTTVKRVFKDKYYDPKVNEYQELGYSKKEATKLADKHYEKIKKVAIGTGVALGATALAAGTLYAGRNFIDYTIKSGTTLQTLSKDTERLSKGSHFYTNYLKTDKMLYKGMFGGRGSTLKYNIGGTVGKDLKIAANHNAEKIFNKTFTNDTIKKAFNEALSDSNLDHEARKELEYARDYILNTKNQSMRLAGKGHSTMYRRYNRAMPVLDKHDSTKKLNEVFNAALRNNGYSGILDVNDTSVSSLRGFRPTIITDRSSIGNITIKQLTNKEVSSATPFGIIYSNKLRKYDNALGASASALEGGLFIGSIVSKKDDEKAAEEIINRKVDNK